jgi:hypothetical protein
MNVSFHAGVGEGRSRERVQVLRCRMQLIFHAFDRPPGRTEDYFPIGSILSPLNAHCIQLLGCELVTCSSLRRDRRQGRVRE